MISQNRRRSPISRLFSMALLLALAALPSGMTGRAGAATTQPTVITFDDLGDNITLTNSDYMGLVWEEGNAGFGGNIGFWKIPTALGSRPHSFPRCLTNSWGCTQIGISFPVPVNVKGSYVSAQGSTASWTSAIRAHGFLAGNQVATTSWFIDINESPDWFEMDLTNIDRIVIESIPVNNGGGWYGLDDLTFEAVPEPGCSLLIGAIMPVLLLSRRRSQGVD